MVDFSKLESINDPFALIRAERFDDDFFALKELLAKYAPKKGNQEEFVPLSFENDTEVDDVCSYDRVAGEVVILDRSPQRKWAGSYFVEMLLSCLLKSVKKQVLTVCIEPYYVDSTYRDSYYSYYSKQYLDISRFCIRLSFFEGDEAFDRWGESEELKCIGTCVLTPLNGGVISNTYIDPRYFCEQRAYIRLSTYGVTIYGKQFKIRAFPFLEQDQETMRCTEVTLKNLINYYSNQYKDYASLEPSDIRRLEQAYIHERATPAKGITYNVLSKVLHGMGFTPRLYSTESLDSALLGDQTIDRFRRAMHYYVESGIPIALNPSPDNINQSGHSLLCIGHAARSKGRDEYAENGAMITREIKAPNSSKSVRRLPCFCHVIDSADYFNDYIVMDDNQLPYACRPFEEISIHQHMSIKNAAVPLHRSMALDAFDAEEHFISILSHPTHGVLNWGIDFLKRAKAVKGDKIEIVKRVFMASSKTLKRFRMDTMTNECRKRLYAPCVLPHFVWVCELYLKDEYLVESPMAFAEIIVDATAIPNTVLTKTIILCHYPDYAGRRGPSSGDDYEDMFEFSEEESPHISGFIKPFKGNLDDVRPSY